MAIGANSRRNHFGIASLSLGSWKHHSLPSRLEEASKRGFQNVELFDEDWADYLGSQGEDASRPWEPTEANLAIARKLANLVRDLDMRISCTQPLRQVEGRVDPAERDANIARVRERFPFMRAFDTDLAFMCSSIKTDDGATIDFNTIVNDLRQIGQMALKFSQDDGGPMIRIGYEGLSWAERNTWSSTWEIVRAVNLPNVGLVVDSFHWLAIEFADPYASAGHGLGYPTLEEALDVLCSSLSAFVATVPAEKIFLYQVADAQLMDPVALSAARDPSAPRIQPWSRGHRLFPMEKERGGYLPVELITAAVIATGYTGPLSIEVFNHSLHLPDKSVPSEHAQRGFEGLQKLIEVVKYVPKFWGRLAPAVETKWGARMLSSLRAIEQVEAPKTVQDKGKFEVESHELEPHAIHV